MIGRATQVMLSMPFRDTVGQNSINITEVNRSHGYPRGMSSVRINPVQEKSTFQLGSDKARSDQARFLIAPVENRTYHFHGIRLSTFGHFSVSHTKRSFPFLQLHGHPPVDSLRVRWVPLFRSFRRLGAFALQSLSWCAQLSWAPTTMPHPTSCEDIGSFVGVSLTYSPLPFASLRGSPVFTWQDSNRMV